MMEKIKSIFASSIVQKETTEKILSETESGYDLISQKFSETRKHFWRELEFIKNYTNPSDNVFDFGCGNGRLLELVGDIENIKYRGADVSQGLINLARLKYPNANFSKLETSQTSLALEDNFFNSIYSIAVFHHFPSKKYRQDLARELYRITDVGGYVIVTVWYLWQKKYFKNILQNWKHKIFGKSELDWNDCEISFTDNQGRKIQRFHHAFTRRELEKLFSCAGFKIEKCEIIKGRNILLVGKK